MPQLELFYDVVSPYSYLAFEVLLRYRPRWKLELVWRPALLAGVMKSVGNVPPATLPARAPNLARDLQRKARYYDVPMGFPEDFPGNTLNAMRLTTLVQREQPQRLEALSRALWERHWRDGHEVASTPSLEAACAAADVDKGLVSRIGEQAVKDALKACTDDAVARGAFGFPAIFTVIDGEEQLFFGSDRFDVLAHELGLPWHGPNPT
jgi:glutathione S-transferase kappa 1